MNKEQCTAIVLAAGQGKRMGTDIQKQYLHIEGNPILYYSLQVFQQSPIIDRIILVVGRGQKSYCEKEIVNNYKLDKVKSIVIGGAERYQSVWNGLQKTPRDGYVFIHDGARPFVDEPMIERVYQMVQECDACVVGMPVKDTIKIVDAGGYANETPDRDYVWMVQTPQVFKSELIQDAYAKLMKKSGVKVTDDAMVVEEMLGKSVKLVEGSYQNIKITTPEDLGVAELFLNKKHKNSK
ncbi:MAG: 2-C-methyl-D-erythritol 4-phosphate cytidylyltransferase [Lachnospiraceae bacterium]